MKSRKTACLLTTTLITLPLLSVINVDATEIVTTSITTDNTNENYLSQINTVSSFNTNEQIVYGKSQTVKNELFQDKKIYINGIENLAFNHTDNITYIYKEPNLTSSKIAILPQKAVCDIIKDENISEIDRFLQETSEFTHIKSGEFEGYVLTKDISTEKIEENIEINTGAEVLETTEIRKIAHKNSTVLTTIEQNETIKILDYSDDNLWALVKYNGEEGYISTSKLNIVTFVDYAYQYSNPKTYKAANLDYETETELRTNLVEFALQFVGNKYVYGGNSLTDGIDCSGFTQQVYRQFGYSIYRTADAQVANGVQISYEELQPGDLLFYGDGYSVGHVAIYIGNDQIVHASNSAPYPQGGIKISNAKYRDPMYCVRIIN